MTAPPPYLVRRLVVAPLVVVGAVVVVAALPLWLVVAAFASRYVPGRWRALRVAWFLFLYLALEAVMLVLLLVVWIGSGFGWRLRSPWFTELHYRLAGWWLRRVMGSARRTFHIVITAENETEGRRERPLLVLSRHAGPGDSLLVVDGLLNGRGRRPRIVLKDLLQLDPCVDVILNRLPNRFVPSAGGGGPAVVGSIAELARGMGAGDAFVIFPEGGNFSTGRRARAIEKLDEIGRPELADRARRMEHLLPPKPAGVLAALAAAPDADVVFVGHVGLERLSSVGAIWRGIPIDSDVVARTWYVRAEEIPPLDDRETWLYDRWAAIDDWIDRRVADGDRGDRSDDDARS